MRKMIVLLFSVLCVMLSACNAAVAEAGASNPNDLLPAPPESILYLGGAEILHQFTVEGGPGASDGMESIIILVPPDLEMEGFHFSVIGISSDGEQKELFTKDDLTPASYLRIEPTDYSNYQDLILTMDYSWYGTLMSMRTINLFTLEEQSSAATAFGFAN